MAYPELTWKHDRNVDMVLMDGQILADVRDQRRLRFRSRAGDELWFGPDWTYDWDGHPGSTIDLACWSFFDPMNSGYIAHSLTFEDHPDEGWFLMTMRGGLPRMTCRDDCFLKGIWNEEEQCFHYVFTTEYEGDLEELYTTWPYFQKFHEEKPNEYADIEITDYFIGNISWLDMYHQQTKAFPRPLYPWFVMSKSGEEFVKAPMVHLPVEKYQFGEEDGSLRTFPKHYGQNGSWFGFLDGEFGGWMTHVLETPVPINYGICWMFYDIHVHINNVIPPRYSCEKVNFRFSCEMHPVSGPKAKEMIDNAQEYNWRTPQYDIPAFSYNNRFDDALNTLPGDEVDQLKIWYQSDTNCKMDHATGYDDTDSVMIERTENVAQPSAWYSMNWGIPWDTVDRYTKRWRMTAMVKTENCTGKVRIGKASMLWGGDLLYGWNTHYPDGEPKARGGVFNGYVGKELDLHWAFAQSLTGTNDWTPMSIEFDGDDEVLTVFLEMSGTGKCWFDNVVLEPIGDIERVQEQKYLDIYGYNGKEKTRRFLERWGDYKK